MSRRITTRRGATVTAGALALVLSSGGVAFADPAPLPPLPSPSPSDLISSTQQTLTTLLTGATTPPDTQPTITVPTIAPSTTPPAVTTPAGTTQQKAPLAAAAPRHPSTAKHATSRTSHQARTPRVTTPTTVAGAPMGVIPAALRLPPATEMGSSVTTAQPPAVAPLIVSAPTHHAVGAASESDLRGHGGAPLRALLLLAAFAAAGAVGAGHLRQLRGAFA